MKPFSVDYYLLVTLSAIGLFQLIANHRRLNGIKIFQNSFITVAFGCLLPISSLIWFFSTEDRKFSDHLGGLSSNELALAFFLGVFTAWILTVILTSGLNHNKFTGRSSDSVGLESLRFFTYFRAVSYNIRFWWKECKTWIEG